jgi:hypothetical protein
MGEYKVCPSCRPVIAPAKKLGLVEVRKFASRFSTYFDKLSTIFMNMRNNCP